MYGGKDDFTKDWRTGSKVQRCMGTNNKRRLYIVVTTSHTRLLTCIHHNMQELKRVDVELVPVRLFSFHLLSLRPKSGILPTLNKAIYWHQSEVGVDFHQCLSQGLMPTLVSGH